MGHPPLAIARDCERMLDTWHTLDDSARSLARAAIEYFLLCRDGDDDAAVVSIVRAHLRL